jgi:hypothetical protein
MVGDNVTAAVTLNDRGDVAAVIYAHRQPWPVGSPRPELQAALGERSFHDCPAFLCFAVRRAGRCVHRRLVD